MQPETLCCMTDLSQILADRLAALHPRDASTGQPIPLRAWAAQINIDRKKLERVLKNDHESQLDTLEHIASRLGLHPLELIAETRETGQPPVGYETELRLLSQLTEGERGEVRGFIKRILAERTSGSSGNEKLLLKTGTNARR